MHGYVLCRGCICGFSLCLTSDCSHHKQRSKANYCEQQAHPPTTFTGGWNLYCIVYKALLLRETSGCFCEWIQNSANQRTFSNVKKPTSTLVQDWQESTIKPSMPGTRCATIVNLNLAAKSGQSNKLQRSYQGQCHLDSGKIVFIFWNFLLLINLSQQNHMLKWSIRSWRQDSAPNKSFASMQFCGFAVLCKQSSSRILGLWSNI